MTDKREQDYGPIPFKGWQDLWALTRSYREHGLKDTMAAAKRAALLRWEFWAGRRFDAKHRVDTTALASVSDLTTVGADMRSGGDYMATSVNVLRGALSALPRELGEFVFIDYGSGKGRALLVASEFSFKRVIGIEYTRELHELAERNIEAYRNSARRCLDVQSVSADATSFEVPQEPCVFYYYNCFALETFEKIVDSIKHSYLSAPRKMYFVFYHLNVECEEHFRDLGIARKLSLSGHSWRLLLPRPYILTLYETV